MAGGAWRRSAARARVLRALLRDTLRALQDVQDILTFDPEVLATVHEIGSLSARPTALVILGSTSAARARLLNCILGKRILPETLPRGCRWLRIQYGPTTQVHLTLGNSEFEFVEELECNRRQWDTLPLQDLLRQDKCDQATMLEIELNNSFLKDGIRIIMPPDLPTEPGPTSLQALKEMHADLYSKRESILKSFNPVYLYALDSFGSNIFNDNICVSKMIPSKSEEEFWSTFNLYYMTRIGSEDKEEVVDKEEMKVGMWKEGGESSVFNAENCLDLHQIKEIDPNAQLFFLLLSDAADVSKPRQLQCDATESTESRGEYDAEDLPESDQDLVQESGLRKHTESQAPGRRLREKQMAFMNDLLDQWELQTSPPHKHYVKSQWAVLSDVEVLLGTDKEEPARRKEADRCLRTRATLLAALLRHAGDCGHTQLLAHCTRLSEVHVKLLQRFILASFELARELQVVPRKVQFVARREQQLYDTITAKFFEGEKKQELVAMMQEVLQEMKAEVNNMDWSVDDLPYHQDKRFLSSGSLSRSARLSPPESLRLGPAGARSASPSDSEEAELYDSVNFDDYEIITTNEESFEFSEIFQRILSKNESMSSEPNTIPIETESLASGSQAWRHSCSGSSISSKQASLDVQRTVLSKLSRKISQKLEKFVDCLKDSYFGTLQRCLESLERSCRRELGGRPASAAARQLVGAPRQLDLQPSTATSLFRDLLDSLRRLFYRLRLAGGDPEEACCVLSPVWRRRVAQRTVHSLSPARLARLMSEQILERLSSAHERYQGALGSLEAALAGRLHHSEDVKLAIRRKYAPQFARLCLESTSMCDLLMYGTPELGREIGRGQYGVVYAVRGSWAGRGPAAVKSVLPADERHYQDLAMEFFYTRSIPPHPRVVAVWGSIVQRSGKGPPGVLLVSARWARDLHAAVRAGLSFVERMRVACDIVEGIRYLHSLGLVHRDVKLKNVLLDAGGRAALADLGFCAAGALLAGSLVGTPVHMAPELLAGRYHAAVDVYAFGVLFWYLCAGSVKLPAAFEAFQNKEQLWSKVKRGLRPERLPHFSDACWSVMESCWAMDPAQRALLGDLQPQLEDILKTAQHEENQRGKDHHQSEKGNLSYSRSDDSLDMTGLHK